MPNTHGGKRAGAGRPRLGMEWVTQSIAFRPDMLAAVRAAAEAQSVSVSEWVRAAIRARLKKEPTAHLPPTDKNAHQK